MLLSQENNLEVKVEEKRNEFYVDNYAANTNRINEERRKREAANEAAKAKVAVDNFAITNYYTNINRG